jgi:diguanylate cyclase (GGDEF)-like protein
VQNKVLSSWASYFRQKNFKAKIIIPTAIVLLILVVAMNLFLSLRFLNFGNSLVDDKIAADISNLKLYLDDAQRHSKTAAVAMAAYPEAVKAIKQRNKNEIVRVFSASHDLFQVNYYTVTDEKGIVLARTHEPDKWGDSVLKQQNVADALHGKVSSFFEEGTQVKVSVRTGAPVYDGNGKLIGVVSAGVRFDTHDEVDKLKRHSGSDYAIFFRTNCVATTLTDSAGERIFDKKPIPVSAHAFIEKRQEYIGNLTINDEEFKAYYMPLTNSANEVFAVFFIGIPKAELIAESHYSIQFGIILGLAGFIVSILLLYFIISSISAPIATLSRDMENVADGNLDVIIDLKSDDEIGRLGKSLKKVVNTVHELIDGIVAMIYEHNRGNTDHRLDVHGFHGYYRTLAIHILELANFSMKDQLTGIMNRRSFNNRLDLEWNRAKRDRTKLSLLIVDVDRFKNYNDTFGHQQGDLALQTVAKVLTQSIKRAVDLAARWGGEEFVVLLPDTPSDGAQFVAEKIRTHIEKAVIPVTFGNTKASGITVSIGVNTQTPDKDSTIDDFISVADNMLYKAKETGRNRVIISVDTTK